MDWFDILNTENVDDAWLKFKLVFCKIIDQLAPVKEIRLKQNSEPWINDEILDCIKRRDKALFISRKFKSVENDIVFKALRNKAQRLVIKAKRDYFKCQIQENSGKKLWQCLKNLGAASKGTCGSSPKIALEINNEIVFDKAVVASCFNNFLVV